ncbi:Sodium channel protein 60E (Drosophila ion channel 60) (Drosophila sodium channel 1) (Protein smell-impaired 60E) (Sodium channel 2) (DmNav2), partial [Durusdinium trenchii]
MDAEVKPIWAKPRPPSRSVETAGVLTELEVTEAEEDAGTELGSAGSEEVPVGSKTESEKVHLPIPGQVEEEPVVESMPSSSSRDGSKQTPTRLGVPSGLFKEFRAKIKKSRTNTVFRKPTAQFSSTKTTAFLARSSTLARNSITDLPSESSGIWGLKHGLEKMVNSPVFELVFAVIIFMNTILMSVQVQYRGLNVGFTLQYPGVSIPAEESWPNAEEIFFGLEMCFGVIFTCEILVKIIALDLRFVYDPWNILDFLIVLAWFVDTISQGLLPLDPLLLRLLRLMKLFRMLRLVRTIQGFDSLYVMITAIRGSVAALFWSTMLLVLVLTTVSLFLQTMLEYYITGSEEEFRRLEVYHYFGTFSRSMVSLCEMTLANWPTPSRVLTENVSEVWIFFVLSFQLLVGFSVMKVIMGVFLQNTFNVASNDDVIMMSQKERAVKVHTKKMEALFDAADENGNGRLDEEEFDSIIQDPACVAWLSAMGLEASLMSGKDLYKLLCAEGTSDLSAVELCNGVASLKGNATSLNMALLQKDQLKIKELMDAMCMSMVKLQGRLQYSHKKDQGG